MKIIYIAGPYAGPTRDYRSYHQIERNIALAREAAAELVRRGYGFFCPHLNSAHFEVITPKTDSNFWIALDRTFLKVCDAVLLIGNWWESRGTATELEDAEALGLHAYHFTLGGLAALERELPP